MARFTYQVVRGCTLCNTCVFECPVGAIRMTSEGAQIDQGKCTGCGTCYDNCASEAIARVSSSPNLPIPSQG